MGKQDDMYWQYRYWVKPREWDKDTAMSCLVTLGWLVLMGVVVAVFG